VQHLIDAYDRVPANAMEFPDTLKWSRNLKRRLKGGAREAYSEQKIAHALHVSGPWSCGEFLRMVA
jgi:hypothetical protein